jgi:hypothetical protein
LAATGRARIEEVPGEHRLLSLPRFGMSGRFAKAIAICDPMPLAGVKRPADWNGVGGANHVPAA